MKSIITKELIDRVSADSNTSDVQLEQYTAPSYFVVGVGCVAITKTAKECYLYLKDENIGRKYMKEWCKDVGILLLRDMKANDFSHLYEFKTSKYKALLRRIDESKIKEMEELGFKHVLIGDFFYTIIKVIKISDVVYSRTDHLDDEELMADIDGQDEEEEPVEEEAELESISLF